MRLATTIVILAACGGGGSDDPDAAPPADAMPNPDAGPGPEDDIGLVPGAPLTAGEWVVVNQWAFPDVVFALDPADLGGARIDVFSANRSWSMGARADGGRFVFSSADPEQTAHFGLTLGDAIQNTFSYDPVARTASLLAPPGTPWINANDECHEPTSDGTYVYLCRRYDFVDQPTVSFKGWRIGRITVADGTFEFIRPDAPTGPFELGPQPIPGGDLLLFELWARPPAMGRAIWTRDLVSGTEVMVKASAARPVLGPDGHTVLFADTTDLYKLWTFDLQAPAAPAVRVSPSEDVGDAAWSPDGQTIVYTVYDSANVCDHIERVTRNGAAWTAPARVRDCAQTGEFLTDISWITVP